MLRRIGIIAVLSLIVTTLLAMGIASADPVNSKNAQIFTLNCGGEEVTFVTNVNNSAPVLNVVDSTSNLVIREIIFTGIDPDTGEILFSDTLSTGQGNQTGIQGELVTCTAPPDTLVDPETGETFTGVISVEGFFTPREG
ncbi:hypothetical protein BH20ACT12_BH20ACT12_07710 [soil metagenome]